MHDQTPSAILSVNPNSVLRYGGQALIDIYLNVPTNDTAILYTFGTQNGVTWLEDTEEVMGAGIKDYRREVTVRLPSPGSYTYEWKGGAASMESQLWIYVWKGHNITESSKLTSVKFEVAA